MISRIPNYTDYGMVMSAKGYEAVALGVDLCTQCGPVKLAAKDEWAWGDQAKAAFQNAEGKGAWGKQPNVAILTTMQEHSNINNNNISRHILVLVFSPVIGPLILSNICKILNIVATCVQKIVFMLWIMPPPVFNLR